MPRARGQAERLVLEAEGYRERRVRTARGEADRFTQMLVAYRLSPEVTARRLYREKLEARLPEVREVIIVDHDLSSVLPLLNLKGTQP